MKQTVIVTLAALAAAWGLAGAGHVAAGGGLPAGFQDQTIASGLNQPTAIAFAPDDRLFILEKEGTVWIVKNGQRLATPFLQVAVNSYFERGLLGIAFDPDFASNGYVYLYYTTSARSPKTRVSRFTASGDTAVAGSERVLIDGIPSDAGNHNGGCLRFGPDGKLYASVGDGGQFHQNAQSLASL